MSAVGETANLVQELFQPRGLARQEHQSAFDLVRLNAHAADLVDLPRIVRDYGVPTAIISQGLDEAAARALVFDQYLVRPDRFRQLLNGMEQLWEFDTAAPDIIEIIALFAQARLLRHSEAAVRDVQRYIL